MPDDEQVEQPVLHQLDFRLSYADCDPAGIVYYAAYYPWFERIYNEWAYLGGFPPSKMHALWGATHISVASQCHYKVPGQLHDPFTCRMRLERVGNTSFSLRFDVDHRETGATYATGILTFVFVDTAALDDAANPPRPVPVPQGLKDVLTAAGSTF